MDRQKHIERISGYVDELVPKYITPDIGWRITEKYRVEWVVKLYRIKRKRVLNAIGSTWKTRPTKKQIKFAVDKMVKRIRTLKKEEDYIGLA